MSYVLNGLLNRQPFKNQEGAISENSGCQSFVRCFYYYVFFVCAAKEGLVFIHSCQITHHKYGENQVPSHIYSCINSVPDQPHM